MWLWSGDSIQRSVMRATRRFQTMKAGSVVIWYDPTLDPLEVRFFRIACRQQVAAVEGLLGAPLRPWGVFSPRPRVLLFRSSEDVSQVYGAPAGGFANFNPCYIVVNLEADWREILRHELAHLIGGRWNPHAPVTLSEGLAVWVQRTFNGHPIDTWAPTMVSHAEDALNCLTGPDPAVGSKERYRYYILAGSFTGAMIRHFGFPRYRAFYRNRSLTNANFKKRFERHFKLSLMTAISQWLSDLDQRQVYGRLLH